LRLKSYATATRRPVLRLGQKTIRLGAVESGEVATFRVSGASSRRIQLGQ
jgi:hypothetical protein